MSLPRRRFLQLTASAAALPLVSRIAAAQSYPTRPVRIIVGFAAGGIVDVFTRLIGQWLSERMGQQFVVENRTGAGSNLAIEAVAKSQPDGYTLGAIGIILSILSPRLRRLRVSTAIPWRSWW